jgi:hypothetical protein
MKKYLKEFPKGQHYLFALIGLTIAILFVIFSSINLTKQGLYYDEVHQAPASFAYVGFDSEKKVGSLSIDGVPLLNMKYSGAIKSAVYGFYLRYLGSHFSVISWRLVSIIFVSAGIFLFSVIAGARMLLFSLVLFLFLFITDITVILATRHDWGPVALALLFRLLFIGIWIHGETKSSITKTNTFFLGFLVGIATFEKLSSVVLIFPLILMFLFNVNRRSLGHFIVCVIGLIVGGIPLILANIYTFFESGTLISLATELHQINYIELPKYLTYYISLGNGAILKHWILGIKTNNHYIYLETFFTSILLLITAITVVLYWKHNKLFRISGVMLLSYIIVGIAIYLLPRPTWVHHWIIGTPFQYTAISFSLAGIYYRIKDSAGSRFHFHLFRVVITAIILVVIVSRLFGFISLERSFFRGDTSITWDPSLSKIGYFASNHTKESIFIAADWGIAGQIYCLSDGYPNFVHEIFRDYKDPKQIKAIIDQTRKNILYVVFKYPKTEVKPNNTERILQDINKLPEWLPGWNEIPVDNEIENLKAVKVRKFIHSCTLFD